MDRQKSCENDGFHGFVKDFHRYKFADSYGALLALIPTMKKHQLQNDNFLITLRKIIAIQLQLGYCVLLQRR